MAFSTNEMPDFIVYDTISAASDPYFLLDQYSLKDQEPRGGAASDSSSCMMRRQAERPEVSKKRQNNAAAQGRKKRRRQRRPKICKNKEEAEMQRMTHIAVERNRRKQMNEHLSALRSLMPQSYVQRGDQASIVSGAIDYVKELEHNLQSLEVQKLLRLPQQGGIRPPTTTAATATAGGAEFLEAPFAQFFAYPQFTWSQWPKNCVSRSAAAVADIEVALIETHANLRILCRRNLRQLSKLVTGFQTIYLTVLHLNVTTWDPLVLYSISAKVEEGCQLTSPDEIAGAVHQMLRIIEQENYPMLTTQ